jgi:formylglycine-generating enzyme required for sulfatase activity
MPPIDLIPVKFLQFTVLSITLAFASCNKKPTLIQGQIFVVTEGGENIKMGAIPVRVIPEEAFKEVARSTVTAIERQKALENEYRASVKVKEQLLKDLDAMNPVGFEAPALVALREEAENEEAIQGLRSPDLEQWLADFARVLPTTQIQTDADGRFTAEVNSKVWLVAGGQRRVGDNKEEYLWVQSYEPPAKGMPQPGLISNRDNVRFKEELYALITPLLGKGADLPAQEAPKPSEAVNQWAARVKGQATQKVAEAKAMHERMVAEAKAKAEAERKERERLAAEAKARAEAARTDFLASNGGDVIVLSSSVQMPVAFIRPGSFTMGSPANEDGRSSDEDQAEVTLSQPFWLAKTEVSQAQWEAVMGNNPSTFKAPNLPVENVSWEDAQSFIGKLNEKQILPPGWKFALPTEAQWEYACRAGEKGPYSGGSLDEVGWYDGNSGSKTHEVGQKQVNAWGLHDMHGNVYEWCVDWYDDTLKGGTDPTGPSQGDYRVGRGGSWFFYASDCRAAYRYRFDPGLRSLDLGFRPALVPSR